MQVAIVGSRDLGDRWDAAFHVAGARRDALHASAREVAERLRETWDEADAVALLKGLDPEILAPVQDLTRRYGQGASGRSLLDRAIREYPHLALALVLREAPQAMATVNRRIAAEEAKLEGLRSLAGVAASMLPGHAYPFRDPARFDGDGAEGYAYALVPENAAPGLRMRAAWVVNAGNESHPSYPDPVPVSRADVDLGRGAFVGHAPQGPRPSPR